MDYFVKLISNNLYNLYNLYNLNEKYIFSKYYLSGPFSCYIIY